MAITILMPDDLLALWPTIQPMLQKWVDLEPNGEFTTKDLLEEGMAVKRDFWIVFNPKPFEVKLVLSTYLTSTPQKKIFFWHLMIGEGLQEHKEEIWRTFCREAAYYGCDSIQMVGRRGLGKTFAKFGLEQLSTIFEYRISEKDGQHGGLIHQHEHPGNVAGSVGDEHHRVN